MTCGVLFLKEPKNEYQHLCRKPVFRYQRHRSQGPVRHLREVVSAKCITDQFTGRSRGFGFVEMSDREEGLKAIQALDSKEVGGRALKVNEAKPRTDSRGGGGTGRRTRRRGTWRWRIPLVVGCL